MLLQPVFHALLAAVKLLICNTSLHLGSITHNFLGISPPQYLTLACSVAVQPTVIAPAAPQVTPVIDVNVSAFSPLSVVSLDTTPQSSDILAPSTYSTDLVVYSPPLVAYTPRESTVDSIDAFVVAQTPSSRGTNLVFLSTVLETLSVAQEDTPALTNTVDAPQVLQHTTDVVIWTPAPTSRSVACTDLIVFAQPSPTPSTDLILPTASKPSSEYFFNGTGYVFGSTITKLLFAAIGIFYVVAVMYQPCVDESLAETICGTVSPHIPDTPSAVTPKAPTTSKSTPNLAAKPPATESNNGAVDALVFDPESPVNTSSAHFNFVFFAASLYQLLFHTVEAAEPTATDTTTTIEDVSGPESRVSPSAAQVPLTTSAPIAPPSASPPALDAEETTLQGTSLTDGDTAIVQPAENVLHNKDIGNGNNSMDDYYSATPVIGGYESPGAWSDLSLDSASTILLPFGNEQDPEQTLVDDEVLVDNAVSSKPAEEIAASSNPESASLTTADVKPSPVAALRPAAFPWKVLDVDPVSDEEEWERDSECSSSPQEPEHQPHSDACMTEVTEASASANSNDEEGITSAEAADWEQVSYKKLQKKLDQLGTSQDESASVTSAARDLFLLDSSEVNEPKKDVKGKSKETTSSLIGRDFSKIPVIDLVAQSSSILTSTTKKAAKPAPVAPWANFVHRTLPAAPVTQMETKVDVVAPSSILTEEPLTSTEPIDYPEVPITLAGFKSGSVDLANKIKLLLAEPRPIHITITNPAVASKKSAAKSNTGEIRPLLPSGHPVSTIEDWDAPS